jgi:ornithine carbamoyltransferase
MDISPRHFLQFKDFSREEFDHLFQRALWIKSEFKAYRKYWPLIDRTLVMIFEKASTRTPSLVRSRHAAAGWPGDLSQQRRFADQAR